MPGGASLLAWIVIGYAITPPLLITLGLFVPFTSIQSGTDRIITLTSTYPTPAFLSVALNTASDPGTTATVYGASVKVMLSLPPVPAQQFEIDAMIMIASSTVLYIRLL